MVRRCEETLERNARHVCCDRLYIVATCDGSGIDVCEQHANVNESRHVKCGIGALTVSQFWEMRVEISPIRTDADHRRAVAEVDRLWGAAEGTPDSDRLDVLATLVDAYEEKRWPLAG